jgi:DNA (cytosine-5)-methyltransferase 1
MRFGSVCSGIEAASVAWHPLGWQAAWLAEIEPFPSAVLAHHYPDTPNLGDMAAIAKQVLLGEIEAPDVLTGGTPCQAFSVAGLRQSLADERGNLTLKFVELLDAIDHVRGLRGREPAIAIWENVPGVLSTKDNAFGCFLAGLAGEDDPLEPPGGKWANAGAVFGPTRAVAWRTLDAQFFGLAQRRRRVFVVASARGGFDPAQVLFEWEGVRRDSAPSREAGQNAAATLDARAEGGGLPGTDGACGGHVAPVGKTLTAGGHSNNPLDENLICMAHGQGGAEIAENRIPTLTCNHEAPIAAYPGTTHTLRGEGFDASEDGTGRGTPLALIHAPDLHPTMVARSSRGGGQTNSPGHNADETLLAFDTTLITSATNRCNPQPGDPCHPLAAGAHAPAIAFPANLSGTQCASTEDLAPAMGAANPMAVAWTTKLHNTGSNNAGKLFEERTTCLDANSPPPALLTAMQVRRLTPTECERLQGFPDDYTLIPWRKKPATECPDGPRYKALGNSWAVPCARWIGERVMRHLAQKARAA